MANKVTHDKTYSTKVSQEVGDKAEAYLAQYDISVSDYLSDALTKAANHEVKIINYLDTPEALEAKREAEAGEGKTYDSLEELWKDLND